jgi:hypothetical protein
MLYSKCLYDTLRFHSAWKEGHVLSSLHFSFTSECALRNGDASISSLHVGIFVNLSGKRRAIKHS